MLSERQTCGGACRQEHSVSLPAILSDIWTGTDRKVQPEAAHSQASQLGKSSDTSARQPVMARAAAPLAPAPGRLAQYAEVTCAQPSCCSACTRPARSSGSAAAAPPARAAPVAAPAYFLTRRRAYKAVFKAVFGMGRTLCGPRLRVAQRRDRQLV
jgi:hypothetical protein